MWIKIDNQLTLNLETGSRLMVSRHEEGEKTFVFWGDGFPDDDRADHVLLYASATHKKAMAVYSNIIAALNAKSIESFMIKEDLDKLNPNKLN